MTRKTNTIIVGGGQGGLSMSFYLQKQGRKHVIFEQAEQAAQAWRDRWDSFTLITPNWMTRLPGAEYQGNNPDAFMPRDHVVAYFEAYIEHFDLPVRYGVQVTAIEAIETGFLLRTNRGEFESANVVIATGMNQQARTPPFSSSLSSDIHQLHSSEYRNPESLPAGGVLVVGSAQSGCQIAEELYQSGRKVFLSVSRAGRIPRRYRGKDGTIWMDELGMMDKTIDTFPSPEVRYAAKPHSTGKDGGHTINLYQFAKDGVVLLGRILSVEEHQVQLAPDLKENLAWADQFEADFVKQVDEFIGQSGQAAPQEKLPGLHDGFEAELILELDLKANGINTVIWATGYKFDFGLVKLPAFDEDGYPLQKRGVTAFPGLYFVGLPFLYTAKSDLLAGVGDDAAHVAEHINTRPVPAASTIKAD